jgi:hypothetical protein
VGAIQHELLESGVSLVTSVEASAAYISAARKEARLRGHAARVSYYHGNFVELAGDLPPADIVTLDRVLCCFDDMESLVETSVGRAGWLYGLVFPRETWWLKVGVASENLFYRLRGISFRGFIHPTKTVLSILQDHGFTRKFYHQTLIWQVLVYARSV